MISIDYVKLAKKGDKDALVDLVVFKKSYFYKIAFSYLKDEDKVLDVMQDAIVIAFHKIKSLRDNNLFYSWYAKILINLCRKHLKQEKRIILLNSKEEIIDIEKPIFTDFSIDIKSSLSKLNYKFREVILLRYYADLSIQHIAKILNCPEGTVKSRIHYGLRLLKQYLDEGGSI